MGQRGSRCAKVTDVECVKGFHQLTSPIIGATEECDLLPPVGERDEMLLVGRGDRRKTRLRRLVSFLRPHKGKIHPYVPSPEGEKEQGKKEDQPEVVEQVELSGKSAEDQNSLQDIICAVEDFEIQELSASSLEVQTSEDQQVLPSLVFEDVSESVDSSAGDDVVASLEQLDNKVTVRRTEDHFSHHYKMGHKLGQGGYGSVYSGTRRSDELQVAIKIVPKTDDMTSITIPGYPKPLPLEVALTILANKGPSVPQIIQLLDWQELPDQYVMILEQPLFCEDMFQFWMRRGNRLCEGLARLVMFQATQAAQMCCRRGVFHRDIKLENLLINKYTLEVKLIDFGCGDVLRKSYKEYHGTYQYCPPEFHTRGEYHAETATVWSLGVMLFLMVCGRFPEYRDIHMIRNNRWSRPELSKGCRKLICACLQYKPHRRIHLDKILQHKWFKPPHKAEEKSSLPLFFLLSIGSGRLM